MDPQTYQAEVDFTVQNAVKLPVDTSAEVTSDGLLGGKYLSLVPGGDEKTLAAGGTVTITQSAISLEQLLGKFIFSVSNLAQRAEAKPAGRRNDSAAAALAAAGRLAGVLPREAQDAGGKPRRTGRQ